jgi:DNA gyrase subunit B
VADIVEKLGKKYNLTLLRAIVGMAKTKDLSNNKEMQAWCNVLQDKLNAAAPMSETHSVTFENSEVVYSQAVYGVEVANNILGSRFFNSQDVKAIQSYSEEVESILDSTSYVQKGSKKAKVESFSGVLKFLLAEAKKGQSFQRYKGLGEMNPDQLWDTTMNAETRTLLRVKIEDSIAADDVFSTLMGDEVEPRRNFIEENALKVDNLDF